MNLLAEVGRLYRDKLALLNLNPASRPFGEFQRIYDAVREHLAEHQFMSIDDAMDAVTCVAPPPLQAVDLTPKYQIGGVR